LIERATPPTPQVPRRGARDGVRRGANRRQQPIDRRARAPHVAEPVSALQNLEFAIEDVDGRAKFLLETSRAVLLHERVRILAGRQRDNAHRCPFPEQRVARAERRLEPRLVAVVEQKHVRGLAPNQCGLLRGERGAQRCDSLFNAGHDRPHHVEVPFDDHDAIGASDSVTRVVQVVQQRSLGIDDGFRGVDVLGLASVK
jgi:hypothetical protein